MRKGFIFNHDLCVACNACRAACMIENGWTFNSRKIYSVNPLALLSAPVINNSMACNHCAEPVCMKGCPSLAYSIDDLYGAVIIETEKCIGCKYCTWNCPYNAPEFNRVEGIIEKCHFCHHRLSEDIEPACTASCPTGALAFGQIPEMSDLGAYSWLPEKGINPSLMITGSKDPAGPECIPARSSCDDYPLAETVTHPPVNEWSLAGFTFLSSLSVSLCAAGLLNGKSPELYASLVTAISAGIISVFHLGRILRGWRSVINIRSSPLSREIVLFLLYLLLTVAGLLADSQMLFAAACVSGIILTLAIDHVYTYSERGKRLLPHSGQSFLSVLSMISFFTGYTLPFIFIATARIVLAIIESRESWSSQIIASMRVLRIALLLICSLSLATGVGEGTAFTYSLLIAGEIIDRSLFYSDFMPLNIANTINAYPNEKETGKQPTGSGIP